MAKENNLTNILEKDKNKKPILNLKEIKNTAVNISTQEQYDELMRVYECGGWKWMDTPDRPTLIKTAWEYRKEQTCVRAESQFRMHKKEWYINLRWNIITPQEFYDAQESPITQEMLDEINIWFDNQN